MEDDLDPPYQQTKQQQKCLFFLMVFWAQKPFQTARTGIFYPGKPGKPIFHGSKPISTQSQLFRIPPFFVQTSSPSDFPFFGVRSPPLKAITRKTSPPGGHFFQKRHPPGF